MKSAQLSGKTNHVFQCLMCVFFFLTALMISSTNAATPQLISYQAQLKDNLGAPLNQTVNVVFTIWDAPAGANALWVETHNSLAITDGKLSVLLGSLTPLDDALFSDSGLYLGVKVGLDNEISPRSRLTAVPYAYRISTIDGATAGNVSGTLQISEGSTPASLVVTGAGGDSVIIAPSDSFTIRATDPAGNPTFSVSVGSLGTSVSLFDPVDSKDGLNAVPTKRVEITPEGILMYDSTGTDTSVSLTATGDISGTGQIQMGAVPSSALATTVFGVNNNASGDTATISGGYNNTASADFTTIGGGFANTASTYSAAILGGYSNGASGLYAVVGGGWDNSASGDLSHIGGGWEDTASGSYSAIGGGFENKASGYGSTVAGGVSNKATATSTTIAGGDHNYAGANYATVGGGISDTASGFYSTIAGGILNRASGNYSTVGGGYGNKALGAGADPSTTVSGGLDNVANNNYATVGGGRSDTAGGVYSGVFSGYSNLAGDASTDTAAFIGGGYNNSVTVKFATVVGGNSNTASGIGSTVIGGYANTASDEYAIVGGHTNNASGYGSTAIGGSLNRAGSLYTAVAGGYNNTASGSISTVGGGLYDTASGNYSTVPGGANNKASGAYSFAAGQRAKATHIGAFVWADSSNYDFSSSAADQFNVRASGGVRIYTNDTLASGVTMGSGASSWTSVSDKSVKKDFRSIDSDELLEKLSEIPISRWKYIAEESQADHIGPMAQDFYSAFGLGDDDKRISTIDADGVALAAIQELYKQVQDLKEEIKRLKENKKE